MRNFLLLILIISVISSCKNKVERPKGILANDKMENVMLDLIKADEIVNQQTYGDSAVGIKNKREILYQKVFQIHQVSKEQFKKSFTFYQNHPDLLKVVLDSMYEQIKREAADTVQIRKPKIPSKK